MRAKSDYSLEQLMELKRALERAKDVIQDKADSRMDEMIRNEAGLDIRSSDPMLTSLYNDLDVAQQELDVIEELILQKARKLIHSKI